MRSVFIGEQDRDDCDKDAERRPDPERFRFMILLMIVRHRLHLLCVSFLLWRSGKALNARTRRSRNASPQSKLHRTQCPPLKNDPRGRRSTTTPLKCRSSAAFASIRRVYRQCSSCNVPLSFPFCFFRRSICALIAQIMVLDDMKTAPSAGLRSIPIGKNAPAAAGIANAL